MQTRGLTVFLLLLSFIFLTHQVDAQQVKFEAGTFDQALAKARKENKPLFLYLPMRPLPTSSPYSTAKMAPIGLESPEVAKAYNAQFINLNIDYTTPEGVMLRKKFAVNKFPMFLYLNPDGQLIYRSFGHSPAPVKYLNDIKAFKKEATSNYNLSYFLKEFTKGRTNPDFLLQYIQLYKKMDLEPTQEILDAYASSLPLNAFQTFSTVQFILEQGPVVDGQAYRLSRSNKKILDSLYRTLPLDQRITINNRIIQNTMQLAKDTRDKDLAWKGANFARSTYSTNKVAGQRSYESNMIGFYRDTKDTANYLRQAATYYDAYYMTVPVDSVKKSMDREQANLKQRMASAASSKEAAAMKPKPGTTTYTERFATIGPALTIPHLSTLNDAAYAVFETGTTHVPYLAKALTWSKRTVDLAPSSPAFHDTYAHLLYRLQLFSEAEEAQKKAVEAARKSKLPTKEFELRLQKIKARTV